MASDTPLTPSGEIHVPKPVLHRAIGASAMGNAVEWFDYGCYGFLTAHIANTLFPSGTNGMVWALAGFAISFLMRPLGGIFWGPLGDKIGRKKVLAMTIILMACSTVLVGLIPSWDSFESWFGEGWGILAPVILYLLRIVQGFSAGGEYGGAATFMAEYAPRNRRGMYGSFLEVGTLLGLTAAAIISLLLISLLGDERMAEWGWRLPFFVALPLGYIGMYLRNKMEDSPVFRELENQQEHKKQETGNVYTQLLTTYLKPTLILFGLVLTLNIVYYDFLFYSPTYFTHTLGMSEHHADMVLALGMLIMAVMLPFFGHLSDIVGRRPMWLFSCIALIIFIVPLYRLMGTGLLGAVVGFVLIGMLFAPQVSTISATFPAMFPTAVRYAGVAIGYNVAVSLFGGTAPAITQWLIDSTSSLGDQSSLMPAWYIMIACVPGVIASWFLIETKGESIRGTEIPGTKAARAEQRELHRRQRQEQQQLRQRHKHERHDLKANLRQRRQKKPPHTEG